MNTLLRGVGLSVLWAAALHAEKLPVEIFAQPALFSDMELSRDGKYVAYKAELEDSERVFIREIETKKILAVEMPANVISFYGRVGNLTWISNKRLLISSSAGLVAIDADGRDYTMLTGYARKLNEGFRNEPVLRTGSLIYYDRDKDSDQILVEEYDVRVGDMRTGYTESPSQNIISLNTRNGFFLRELENPGSVVGWLADRQREIRLGIKIKGIKQQIIYRENEKAPWTTLNGLGDDPLDAAPVTFSDDGKQLFVSKVNANGHYALYTYDLAEDRVDKLVLEHELYDISPTNGGWPIKAPDGRLIGINYNTDMPKVMWFDPNYAAIQQAIDRAIPRSVNRIVSITQDEQKLLVFARSARNPGTYYLFDRRDNSLSKFADICPWVDPEKLAEMLPFKFKARDSLTLHGYLTVPAGKQMKNLPLIVMPHGGPWLRDNYTYNSQIQFLANRGYAVLQVNYRGSTGYGLDFYKKGFRVVGTTMQDDIEDATRWAIAKGIADPKRVAIMGGSFGGYSTLMGLIRTPDLYRCGINIAGVTDWADIIKRGSALNPRSYAFSVDRIGDPKEDADILKAISPVYHVEKIKAPLLIVHGRDDSVVPYDQAKALVDALDKKGKVYELMAKYNEPHGIYNYKNRIELYNRIEAFLEKYMPAD